MTDKQIEELVAKWMGLIRPHSLALEREAANVAHQAKRSMEGFARELRDKLQKADGVR